jgi:hypothetical protein
MVARCLTALALLTATAVATAEPPPAHVRWARAALDRIPVAKADRTPERLERRAEQREAFAVEIARVSERAPLPPQQWAALLVTQGSIESNFDSAVVDGQCLAHQCDPHLVKGVRVFRAVGAFQQQLVAHVADLWPTAAGNIPAQVEMADRSLRRSLSRCKPFAPFPAHVFRAYGGGSCSWPAPREAERVGTYLRVLRTPIQKLGATAS